MFPLKIATFKRDVFIFYELIYISVIYFYYAQVFFFFYYYFIFYLFFCITVRKIWEKKTTIIKYSYKQMNE